MFLYIFINESATYQISLIRMIDKYYHMSRRFTVFRSGQVSPISAVIMTGIVVSLVGIAYIWGIPLIQKRASMTEFSSMERLISDVRDNIEDLSRAGSGEVTIPLTTGLARLVPKRYIGAGNNTLIIEFIVDQPVLLPNTTMFLGATSIEDISLRTGLYGEASPSIVKLSGSKQIHNYLVVTEIIYRELLKETPPKTGYVIALCPEGNDDCDDPSSGNSAIRLSFEQNIRKTGAAAHGGDLVETIIRVGLS